MSAPRRPLTTAGPSQPSPPSRARTLADGHSGTRAATQRHSRPCPARRNSGEFASRIARIETYLQTAVGDHAHVLAGYRRLRKGVPVTVFPHPPAIVRRAVDMLPRDHRIQSKALHRLVGGHRVGMPQVYAQACAYRGETPHCGSAAAFQFADPLGPWLKEMLGPLPRTALASDGADQWPAAGLRVSAAIHALTDPSVRLLGGIALQLAAARGTDTRVQGVMVTAFQHLDAIFASCTAQTSEARAAAIERYLANPRYALSTRNAQRSAWRRELKRVEDYLAEHPEAKAKYAPWRIVLPAITEVTLYRRRGRYGYAREIDDLKDYLASATGSPEHILAGYRRRRAAIKVRVFPHPKRVLDLALETLVAGEIPTRRQLHALIGGPVTELKATYDLMCERLGHLPQVCTPTSHRPPDRLSAWVLRHLGALPETCLDPDLGNLLPAPRPRRAHNVAKFQVPAVRMTAALVLYLAAARGVKGASQIAMVAPFGHLDGALLAAGAAAGDEPQPISTAILLQAIGAFLKDETRSLSSRHVCWMMWKRQLGTIDSYMVRKPSVSQRYDRCRIAFPFVVFAAEGRRLAQRAIAERQRRRDISCAPTALDPAAIYRAYDTRFQQIADIRAHFDTQCQMLAAGDIEFDRGSARFSVTLPRTHPDAASSEGNCTLEFAVTTPEHLARRVPSITPTALARAGGSPYLLEYIGPREPADRLRRGIEEGHESTASEPPLLAMYRSGSFLNPCHSSAERLLQREQLLPRDGWPQSSGARRLFNYIETPRVRLATQCLRHDIILIPIHELHHAVAVGRALGRSILRGARIGETMQQHIGPASFVPVASAHQALWSYNALAKGRSVPEPYLLSAQDMQAVLDVLRTARANGWSLPVIAPTSNLKEKCRPQRFLYQRGGVPLHPDQLTLPLALPLWPGDQRGHDLRHGIARHLRHIGHSLNSILALLHHKSPLDPSSAPGAIPQGAAIHGYIRPIPAMQAELVDLLAQIYEETP